MSCWRLGGQKLGTGALASLTWALGLLTYRLRIPRETMLFYTLFLTMEMLLATMTAANRSRESCKYQLGPCLGGDEYFQGFLGSLGGFEWNFHPLSQLMPHLQWDWGA